MKDYLPEQEQLERISQQLYQLKDRIYAQEMPDFKVCWWYFKISCVCVFQILFLVNL